MGIFENFTGRKHKEIGFSGDVADASSREDDINASVLDAVSSCVMIADEKNLIVRINPAAMKMLHAAEQDLREALPDFSAANLLGSSIDIFCEDSAQQHKLLESLSSTEKWQITLGARTFDLTASPIFSVDKVRLGTVLAPIGSSTVSRPFPIPSGGPRPCPCSGPTARDSSTRWPGGCTVLPPRGRMRRATCN